MMDPYENKTILGAIVRDAAKAAVHNTYGPNEPDMQRLNNILVCEAFVSALVGMTDCTTTTTRLRRFGLDVRQIYRHDQRRKMTITDKIIDVLAKPSAPPPGGFRDDLPEAFAALNADGSVMVIGYQGEWYEPIRLSLRTRLHNWLISRYNRQSERDEAVAELCNAIRLTVEYVGTETLHPNKGWSWYDALNKYRPDILARLT